MWKKILKFILGIPLIYIIALPLQSVGFWVVDILSLQKPGGYQWDVNMYSILVSILHIVWFIFVFSGIFSSDIKTRDLEEKSTFYYFLLEMKTVGLWFLFVFAGLFSVGASLFFAFSSAFGGDGNMILFLIGGPILSVAWVVLCIKFFILGNKDKESQKNREMEVLNEENGNILQDKAVSHSPTLQKIIENIQKDEKN